MRGTSGYRWLFLVLPAYAIFAFGRSSWPVAIGLAVAIAIYNTTLTLAERRWPDWTRSRAVFLRCVEIGLFCIALSLIYLKGRYATLFEFYYDGFYAIPVIFAATAGGRRGLLWSVVAATFAVAFGQFVIAPQPAIVWSTTALEYWSSLAGYSAIYSIFFATVGGLALFVREYGTRRQRDLMLKLAGSFAGLRDAVLITDPRGRVVSMNRAAESLFACRVYQAFSRPVVELCPDLEMLTGAEEEAVDQGGLEESPVEITARTMDKREVSCEAVVSAYRADDELVAYVLVVRDISGRVRLEQEITDQGRMATLGRMATGVAHDIENPLAGIRALSELMLMDDRPAEERKALEMMREEADRVSRMLRDLLQFARGEDAPRAEVDLNEIVERAVRLRRYAPQVPGVEIEAQLGVPAPMVLGNPSQLEQVVVNLVLNGEQAMSSRGRGRLIVRSRAEGDRALLEVEDSGPGVPDDFIERIFDPFFTTRDAGQGTGLGLSLSRDIIRQHGGALEVRNRDSGGACFVVELPLHATAHISAPTAPAIPADIEAFPVPARAAG